MSQRYNPSEGLKISVLSNEPVSDWEGAKDALVDLIYDSATVADSADPFLSIDEVEAAYLPDGMILDAISSTLIKLPKQIKAVQRVINAKLGNDLKLTGDVTIGNVKKSGLFASVAAMMTVSDGQTVSVIFHAPDGTPNKIGSKDTLIAFRWLLNRTDITGHVAPVGLMGPVKKGDSKGNFDISLSEVAVRVARLIEENSKKFQDRSKRLKDQKLELTALTGSMGTLEESIREANQQSINTDSKLDGVEARLKSLEATQGALRAENAQLEREISTYTDVKKDPEDNTPLEAPEGTMSDISTPVSLKLSKTNVFFFGNKVVQGNTIKEAGALLKDNLSQFPNETMEIEFKTYKDNGEKDKRTYTRRATSILKNAGIEQAVDFKLKFSGGVVWDTTYIAHVKLNESSDDSNKFISDVVNKIRENKKIPLVGDGLPLIYVKDDIVYSVSLDESREGEYIDFRVRGGDNLKAIISKGQKNKTASEVAESIISRMGEYIDFNSKSEQGKPDKRLKDYKGIKPVKDAKKQYTYHLAESGDTHVTFAIDHPENGKVTVNYSKPVKTATDFSTETEVADYSTSLMDEVIIPYVDKAIKLNPKDVDSGLGPKLSDIEEEVSEAIVSLVSMNRAEARVLVSESGEALENGKKYDLGAKSIAMEIIRTHDDDFGVYDLVDAKMRKIIQMDDDKYNNAMSLLEDWNDQNSRLLLAAKRQSNTSAIKRAEALIKISEKNEHGFSSEDDPYLVEQRKLGIDLGLVGSSEPKQEQASYNLSVGQKVTVKKPMGKKTEGTYEVTADHTYDDGSKSFWFKKVMKNGKLSTSLKNTFRLSEFEVDGSPGIPSLDKAVANGYIEIGESEEVDPNIAMINKVLNEYGARLAGDLIEKNGKTLSVKISIKGNRIRFEGNGALISSGPIKESTVSGFVEEFWSWNKATPESEAPKSDDAEDWDAEIYTLSQLSLEDYEPNLESLVSRMKGAGVLGDYNDKLVELDTSFNAEYRKKVSSVL